MTAGIRATGTRPTADANGTRSSSALTGPSYERGDLLAAVAALTPILRAASDEVEHRGSLTEPLVQALVEAGLYRMLLPRALGGGEIDPLTYFDVTEALAQADSAAAWSVLISTSWPAACYSASIQARRLFERLGAFERSARYFAASGTSMLRAQCEVKPFSALLGWRWRSRVPTPPPARQIDRTTRCTGRGRARPRSGRA
jgi:hypothetical protein